MSFQFCDTIIRNGLVIDGSGGSPRVEDIAISNGKVLSRGQDLNGTQAKSVIDASGKWVMPGLLDIHTHLDLEVEVNPALEEVVRHGTTSVVVGNCSLGTAFGAQRRNGDDPIIDCFARVENISKDILGRCADKMTWDNTADYLAHIDDLPLGPSIAPLIPHSMLRIEVMGVDAAVYRRPTEGELGRMRDLLTDAMVQGYPGFSTDGLPFHYLANAPNTDKRVPTQYASMAEMKSLLGIVRSHGRVWQATPDTHDKLKTLRWFLLTSGRFYGRPLRVSALTAIDPAADPNAWKTTLKVGKLLNSRLVDGKFHFQVLSAPFKIWGDGITMPAFEELDSSRQLIAFELEDRAGRCRHMDDAGFRRAFISDWNAKSEGLTMYRDLGQLFIERCPVASWQGMSFAQVLARVRLWQSGALAAPQFHAGEQTFFEEYGQDVDSDGALVFALLRAFDRDIRWWVVTANHRPDVLRKLLWDRNTLPGFNDSGAHLTNMAFFDGNLTTLQMAQAESMERVSQAVRRLTRDPAEFFGLEVGTLDIDARADITIVDPIELETYDSNDRRTTVFRDLFEHEQLVNRSEGVVTDVLIGGEVVWQDNSVQDVLGKKKLGQALTTSRV